MGSVNNRINCLIINWTVAHKEEVDNQCLTTKAKSFQYFQNADSSNNNY